MYPDSKPLMSARHKGGVVYEFLFKYTRVFPLNYFFYWGVHVWGFLSRHSVTKNNLETFWIRNARGNKADTDISKIYEAFDEDRH